MLRAPRSRSTLPLVLLAALAGGCAGSDDAGGLVSDLGETVIPGDDLNGTGYYLIDNAWEAEFVECSGDAAALEGLTFAGGYELAPICVPAGSFTVAQSGGTVTIAEHEVACSDGSSALIGGVANFGESGFSGTWQSASSGGQASVQSFTGTISEISLEFHETHVSFSGAFEGACSIAPPLSATLIVI